MSRPLLVARQIKAARRAPPVKPPPADPRLLLAAMRVESSDDAIIGKYLRGIITAWNPAAQRLCRYTDEVVGKHTSVLIPPDRLGEVSRWQTGERSYCRQLR